MENKYLVNNKSKSQYLIIYHLLAMTEVKHTTASPHQIFTPCFCYFGSFLHAEGYSLKQAQEIESHL